MPNQLLIRLISSKDHGQTLDALVKKIRTFGTDRYDPMRKQQFDDFYGKHNVQFFATPSTKAKLENDLSQLIDIFPKNTMGDRNLVVEPDIAIIYDGSKCKMIQNVYKEVAESDCYQFTTTPKDALLEVRILK
ncbi:MAG TPA: hypothetical protein PL051_02950 [Candidatus Saccharibacteria bacterium]|nr:hypothetical protein [Candidatus Saccharibacteria bacterium]